MSPAPSLGSEGLGSKTVESNFEAAKGDVALGQMASEHCPLCLACDECLRLMMQGSVGAWLLLTMLANFPIA